jgi:serine/threonine-protein kinase
LEPGTIIDNVYEVGEELGSGAFGKVFEGIQHPIRRKVAIKVLALNSDDQVRKRFLREAQAAAAIDHPNVVTIYHFGFLPDGPPYIVMEFLNGHDLEQELETNGALTPSRTKDLFVRCLDALASAHAHGIIHKDLKPSNLYLTYPGEARELLKIVDFGIAHVMEVDSSSRLTMQGSVVGTPQYLAPEYIETQSVSPAVDVYQMGLIMSEALTAQPVVGASNLLDAVVAHVEGVCLPEEVQNSAFGPVLTRAVSRKSEDRYADAGALRDALATIDPTSDGPAPDAPDDTADTTVDQLRSGPPVAGPADESQVMVAAVPSGPSGRSPLALALVGFALLMVVPGGLVAWSAGFF